LAVAKWLNLLGWTGAERSRAGWTDDRGDIDGIPGVCIEVKNEKRIDLPGYLRELEVEMKNAKAWAGAVIVKRRGSADPADWYAVMPAQKWAELLLELDQPNNPTTPPDKYPHRHT
jgi:hypothetical protein